jgi:hypothetical protein
MCSDRPAGQGFGLFLGFGVLIDALQRADETVSSSLRGRRTVVGDFAQGDDRVLVVVAIEGQGGAVAAMARARCPPAEPAKAVRNLSTQSSTVTRAMNSSCGGENRAKYRYARICATPQGRF